MATHPALSALTAALLAAGVLGAQGQGVAPAADDIGFAERDLAQRVAEPIAVIAGVALERGDRSAARLLLSDPAVRALWSHAMQPAGTESAFDQLGELIAMSTGEFELVVTRLPRATENLPGVLGRFRLDAERAEHVRRSLSDGSLAEPARRVGAIQTYILRSSSNATSHRAFELALVGADLVLGNHATDLEEVLVPASARGEFDGEAVAPGPLTFPEGWVGKESALQPGAVAATFDWAQIASRLARHEPIAEHHLMHMQLSDAATERVDLVAEPLRRGLRTVVSLRRSEKIADDEVDAARSTLQSLESRPVREFLEHLPFAPSAAVSVVYDVDAVDRAGSRSGSAAGMDFGLQFGAQLDRAGMHTDAAILDALGPLGDGAMSLQLFGEREDDGRTALRSVAAVHVGNPADAAALVEQFAGSPPEFGIYAAVEDAVVIGADGASIEAAQAAVTANPDGSKVRRSRRQRASRAMGRLRTERAIAAFRIDAKDIRSRDIRSRDVRGQDSRGKDKDNRNMLDGSHLGVVSLDRDEDSGRNDVHFEIISSM